ncbi:hypothetical protein AYK26_03740 [Euryarchaeota archaeon SM23-78]|nr:MAG: hypothetical protein AYK26_03740 [Euryarchaeota archaeon SM23-78]MBW3000667.1 hypothetical protein [Candidatus Woesearchaeota archaeon]
MTQEKDMTKVYEKLKKKHGLPDLNELDKEFNIGKLEETDLVLRFVVSKMSERLEQVSKILGDLIQPENNLSNMYEAEAFTDDEKKKIFELFKKLSYHHTQLVINDFEHSEDSAAELIKKTYKEWLEQKKEFLKILDKIKEAWKKETKSRLELGYFG